MQFVAVLYFYEWVSYAQLMQTATILRQLGITCI